MSYHYFDIKFSTLGLLASKILYYCIMGCHGNNAISHNLNRFIFREHNYLHLSGLIDPFDINKKCS